MPQSPAVCPDVINLAKNLGYNIQAPGGDCSVDTGVVVAGSGRGIVTELHWSPTVAPLLSCNINDPNWNALVDLNVVVMSNQNLSGTLPLFFSTSSTITQIDLSGNKIAGTLANINNPSLKDLNLSDNLFTGSIPLLPSSLSTLNLSNNRLTGSIPPVPSTLTSLSANNNGLTGSIPTLSGTSLTIINLSSNLLSGLIPTLPNTLTTLKLSGNALTGTIPSFVASMTSVNVAGNQLSGNIPTLPTGLTSFTANLNGLTGPLPSFVGKNIVTFNVNSNQISGTISPFPTNLITFIASNNLLSGSIPATFGNVKNFQVSNNNLSGIVPNVPIGFANLYLNDNAFTSVGTLGTGLTTSNCDISNNQIYYWLAPTWTGKCVMTNLLTTAIPSSTTISSTLTLSISMTLAQIASADQFTTTFNQVTFLASQSLSPSIPSSPTSQPFGNLSSPTSQQYGITSIPTSISSIRANNLFSIQNQSSNPVSHSLQSAKSSTTRTSSTISFATTGTSTIKNKRVFQTSIATLRSSVSSFNSKGSETLIPSIALDNSQLSPSISFTFDWESKLLTTDSVSSQTNIATSSIVLDSTIPSFDESTFIPPVAMISILLVVSLLIAGCFIEMCLRRTSKDKIERRSLFKKETRKQLFSIFETGESSVLPTGDVINPAYKVVTVQKAREYPKK